MFTIVSFKQYSVFFSELYFWKPFLLFVFITMDFNCFKVRYGGLCVAPAPPPPPGQGKHSTAFPGPGEKGPTAVAPAS
jgi:hypothetical protein